MWNLSEHGGKIAVISETGTLLSYKELDDRGHELAEAVGGRCLIFIMCRNEVGSLLGYISAINNNIVPLMLNDKVDISFLVDLLNKYKPEYVWAPADEAKERKRLYNAKCTAVFDMYGYALYKTDFTEGFPLNDKLALLLTTSGSTGSPKFVRQSYANIRSNTEAIVNYLKLDDSGRAITTLPMNYTYGLSIINSHLMVGSTLLITDKSITQREFWNFFRENEAESFGGVPFTYECLDRMRFQRMDLPSLKFMTQAGGKLTPELHEKFASYAAENNKQFIVMYGQCEATARMGYLPPERSLQKKGSMGIAIPGGKFHIKDVDGKYITEPDKTGELVYEGDNVTLGYAESGADLIKDDERHGLLETGDMARVDSDGYYYIVGRKKRFLKIYGNRVNLDEIDRLIKTEFNNIDVASTGIDDHMYIFVTDEKYEAPVREFVIRKTGLNQAAFKSLTINEIPKNDAGKILYKELSKYMENK